MNEFNWISQLLASNKNHPYLLAKKIEPLNIKSHGNNLVVPFYDASKQIVGGQLIYADGQKKTLPGSKLKGSFFEIPETTNHHEVYLVEGYATGVSVHRATGAKVVVTFGTSNLEEISKLYPDAIVAADHDEAGIKAAKNTGLRYTYPPNEKQDWNDFYQETDRDTVLFHIHNNLTMPSVQPKKTDCPFVLLGKDDKKIFVFLKSEKIKKELSIRSINKNEAIDLCGLDYLKQNYATEKSFSMDLFLDDLTKKAKEIGLWDESKNMGVGVWRNSQGKLIYHDGSNLLIDGEKKELGFYDGKLFEAQKNKFFEIAQEEITPEERKELIDCTRRLSWRDVSSPELCLGWLTMSTLCGILGWRSHIWITGGFGSGKSRVKDLLFKPLSGAELRSLSSTEAGLRQENQNKSVPIIYEEAESDDWATEQHVKKIIRMVCLASEESSSHVVKGSADGKPSLFEMRFMGAFFSIHVNLVAPQYRSRFSVLELVENKNNGFSGKGGTEERLQTLVTPDFCNRFMTWRLNRVDLIQKNYKTFFKYLKEKYTARFADQAGSLLAGAYTLEFDSEAKEIEEYIERLNLKEVTQEADDRSEENCLAYLFSRKIQDGSKSYSVGEIVERIYQPSLHSDSVESTENFNRLLEIYGMKVNKEQALAVVVSHAELKGLFRGSSFESGWIQHLRRLPFSFSRKVKGQVWLAGKKHNCVYLDLIKIMEGKNDDQ